MASGYNVRVGDADRDAVATQLREHFADGRLTLEELNERLDQAFAANAIDRNKATFSQLYAAANARAQGDRHCAQGGRLRARERLHALRQRLTPLRARP